LARPHRWLLEGGAKEFGEIMKCKLSALSEQYATGLKKHLSQGPRASLEPARRLGRRAMAIGLETLDVARIHERALASLEVRSSADGVIERAGIFFTETVAPIEGSHHAALQANARLKRLNKTLSQRTLELATSGQSLKQGIAQRKAAEAALEKSGGHYKTLLRESLALQKHLQHLTHRNQCSTVGGEKVGQPTGQWPQERACQHASAGGQVDPLGVHHYLVDEPFDFVVKNARPVRARWPRSILRPACIPDWLRGERRAASPPDDFADVGGYFFAGDAPKLAALDFLDAPVNLGFPGGFDLRVAGVQVFGQTAHQFPDFFRWPVAGFFNDLFQCQWHGGYHTMFGLWVQPWWPVRLAAWLPGDSGREPLAGT
jgi:hypothetical protein